MKIEIKSRWSGEVLFAYECEQNDLKKTLKVAFDNKVNLRGADLRDADLRDADLRDADLYGADLYGADLYGADLYGADLRDADLRGANLRDADLRDADLYGADLYGADLYGADLRDADLRGANLRGADLHGANLGEEYGELIGDRPVFTVGPIGSRNDVLMCFIADKGVWLRAGCFFGSIEQFQVKMVATHGDNKHAEEYKHALELIRAHVKLWGSRE